MIDLDGASRLVQLCCDIRAGIIAVKGDPHEDITELKRVGFIMKGGVVEKTEF